jgi:NAD(P)-dependent dehydrogenase (short-subunit alcohol dehydrogenase family)
MLHVADAREALPIRVTVAAVGWSGMSVVVVGGASGIGAAVVQRYSESGIKALVWDVRHEADVVCDVTDPVQVDAAMAKTVHIAGPPTEVTVTAGIGHAGRLTEVDPDDWDRVVAVNAKGPWLVMRGVARILEHGGLEGSIIAVSSVSARIPDRSMGVYCASKAALSMVVRVAAAEWAPAIRVNAVAPGVTATPMLGPVATDRGWLKDVAGRTVMGRIGTADDIAEAVLGLHRLGWVTGQVLEVDGGLGLHSPIEPERPLRGR